MNLTGKIKVKGEEQTIGTSGFKKRELVIVTDEQYPQSILIEFVQDKCQLIDSYNIGEVVTVDINVKGRGWTNPEGIEKYFNSLQGWRLKRVGEAVAETSAPDQSVDPDDLPF